MKQDFKKTIFKKHNLIFIKKIKFLARLLALTLFAIFISCNEELYDIKDQHDGVDKNKISLTQFKNETNIGRIDPIVSVPSTKSLSSKTKAQLSDFIIDTLAIKKLVSENNKTTYTFRIYPLSSIAQPNEIYNLVYRKVNNTWETSIFYLKKLPKEDSDHKLFEKIERLDGGKVSNTLTSKTSSAGMCGVETTSVQCDDSCRQEGYPQCDGFGCPTGQCLQRRITWLSCDAGTEDSGGSNNTGTTSGPGGGAGSEPYTYSPNIYDNKIYEDPNYINEINREYFYDDLDYGIQLWVTTNTESYHQTIEYLIQNNWSAASKSFASELLYLAKDETNQADVYNIISTTLKLESATTNIFEDDFALTLDPYIDLDLNTLNTPPSTLTPNLFVLHTYMKYRLLRQMNPTWSKAHCAWEASKEIIHISLDTFGLIPVGGEVADLINGALYTIEGDGLNATLSYASAVPVAGWAAVGVKYAVKIKTVATIGTKVKLTWKVLADGTIYFGSNNTCRAQLRKVLGLAVGNLNQAHHIIPLNLQTNPIVQKAAKSGSAFHLNEALNGIPLSTAVHNGSHANYDGLIFQKLYDFEIANPNATPSQCYNKVNEVISQIRTAIANNPNTPINQLNF